MSLDSTFVYACVCALLYRLGFQAKTDDLFEKHLSCEKERIISLPLADCATTNSSLLSAVVTNCSYQTALSLTCALKTYSLTSDPDTVSPD